MLGWDEADKGAGRMPGQIKVYYARLHNMGDQLNELILKKCFGYEAVRCSFLEGELCAIGSCLGMYTLHGTFPMRIRQRINGIALPHVSIWGTGFINYSDCEGRFFKRDMDFCAVRGELTRKRVEQMTARKLDIPTADAGLLASELLKERPQKRCGIGIIPHLCDLKDPKVTELLGKYTKEAPQTLGFGEEDGRPYGEYENARFINVKDEPLKVIREIAECRYILSSSLHGLIVADSFGIPNMHVVFGDRLLGDGYKFDDYYSAYGMEHHPYDLRSGSLPDINEIEDRYEIRSEAVEEKKRELKEVFPFPVMTAVS